MPGARLQFLGEDAAVAEAQLGLGDAGAVRGFEFFLEPGAGQHGPHPSAAAAGDGLDHHAGRSPGGEGAHGREVRAARRGGGHRDAGGDGRGTRGGLVAERPEHVGSGPDEDEPRGRALGGEIGVLREEAVARMHRVGAGARRGRDDRVAVQVRRGAGTRERDGVVRRGDVRSVGVVRRVHRHRRDAEFPCGADDPQCDLAAVGDEQFHFDSPSWNTAATFSAATAGLPSDAAPAICAALSNSTSLRTLPVAVIGSASTTTKSGTL